MVSFNPTKYIEEPERTYLKEPRREEKVDEVRRVSMHEMPSFVRGFYEPINDRITLPNDPVNLPGSTVDNNTLTHEYVHKELDIRDEYQTDAHTANRTGHYEFLRTGIREPYRPNLN